MFRSDMTPEVARAELHRLKALQWRRMLALLDELVPPPASDAPEAQADWIDVLEFGGMEGGDGFIYCRTVLGGVGNPLIGMVGVRCDPPSGGVNPHGWNPQLTGCGLDRPLIEVYREQTWGTAQMELLRTHLPLRRNPHSITAPRTAPWLIYELLQRDTVRSAIAQPASMIGARIGFRCGAALHLLADPEFLGITHLFHASDEDAARVRGVASCSLASRFVPEGEGIPELRARAAEGR